MDPIEALILGIVQGLTEFLPVSSSGHIELGKAILNRSLEENLTFTVIVHFATVLSTIVVFRNDIAEIINQIFKFSWNEETKFALKIIISMIPVTIVGLTLRDPLESLFNGNILLVGCMLIITGILLLLTVLVKQNEKPISNTKAFIIGISQAVAVLPGISRSGSTIATGLLLGIDRAKMARFSFLMVIPPIVGATLLELKDLAEAPEGSHAIELLPLVLGFLAAFSAGLIACKWMISIVKKGKIQYFAAYCFIVGLIAIAIAW